jgi:hypothetical protein
MQAPSLTVAPSPLGHLRRSTAVSLKYPERLSLYLQPPELEITVEQFEIFALDRLQGLDRVILNINYFVILCDINYFLYRFNNYHLFLFLV